MAKKIRIGLIFGGRSGEHEVSVRSAASVRQNLDWKKYRVLDIEIGRDNQFDTELIKQVDVIFPVFHGTYGEDGCLQGMLEMQDKPYVGAGVLGSAVGMDKDVQKRLLIQAGIPVAKYQTLKSPKTLKALKPLKYPVFVKPANMGSSVGISKCKSKFELISTLKKAFLYDTKALIEEEVRGRELEVSVLGNPSAGSGQVQASIPGEVKPQGSHEFYDYEAKYIDEEGAELIIPAKLPSNKVTEIQKLAIKTFEVLECSGMARVDMFLRPNGGLVINEINTLPGFTNISMYPKLWEAFGISYSTLLDKLIDLAIEKKRDKDRLRRDV